MRCCWDLVRFALFITNFAAFVVIGLALALSVFILIEPQRILKVHVELNLSPDNPTALYFSFLLILIVVFGFLCLFTFLGCCGAACQNRCMLGSFVVILVVFMGANMAAIAYMYTQFPGGEVKMLSFELKKTIAYYKADDPDSMAKKFWDWLQPTLECCGASSVYDWGAAELKVRHKVPASCCPVVHRDAAAECVYNPSLDNGAFLTGCVEKMSFAWRVAFWALPSLMALILIFTLIVCGKDETREPSHGMRSERRRYNKPLGRRQFQDLGSQYSEETGYVYRSSSTPTYSREPPFNPDFHRGGYTGNVEHYPTGVIPPSDYRKPLMQQPPSYQDVIGSNC